MISLVNVSKEYHLDGITSIMPIRDVNLEVRQGEFLMIVGRSGSGKTTLLNLCAGLIKPTTGQVIIDGIDIQRLSDKRVSELRSKNIGFIFQFQSMLPNLTVIENVAMAAAACNNIKGDSFKRAAELLEMVGLAERMKVYPRQLSAGELRRVAIARALMNKPETLLADEPTADLDVQTEFKIISLLQQIHKSGITIIMITHNLNLVRYSTRALKVENGELIPVNLKDYHGLSPVSEIAPVNESRQPSEHQQAIPTSISTIQQERQTSTGRMIWAKFKPATLGLVLCGVALGAFALGLSFARTNTPLAAQTTFAQTAAQNQASQLDLAYSGSGNLAMIRQYDSLAVNLNALMTFEFLGTDVDSMANFKVPTGTISWSGTSFSGEAEREDTRNEVSGTVSADGTSLLSLVYSRKVTQGTSGNGIFYRVTLQDLPLTAVKNGAVDTVEAFEVKGAEVQKYIVNIEYIEGALDSDIAGSAKLKSVDWANPTFKPVLKVSFGKSGDSRSNLISQPGTSQSMGMQ